MGAAGEIAKALIGPELAAAENIFGSSKVGGGDTLGKSVTKASKTSLMEVNAGSDISILIGLDNLTIKDTKNPSHNPTTLRGQLANILGALIWVSKKNISGGGGSPGPGAPGPGSAGVSGGSTGKWGALLDLISSKESGGNYEAMYPSTTLKGATKMTISEVARRATGAVGKYQQLPQYLISRAKAAGLNPDKDLYSPENQDKIISVVNIEQNRGGRAWLAGQRSDEAFMQGLSQEFASLPNAQGKFHYSGQSSSHKPSEVRDALKKVKESSIKMAQGGLLKRPRPGNGPLMENKMIMKEDAGTSKFAKGGKIFLHWTAGGYQFKQPGHYHSVVQGDGTVARLHDYNDRSVSHTYKRNGTGVGLSIAAMGGNPDPWSMPPKPIQITNMAKEIANIAKSWKWKPSDINLQNVMTHAEAASLKDGSAGHDNYGPKGWGGTGERWDLWQLKKGEPNGSGGNKLRAMARGFMGGDSTVKDESGASTTISPSDSNSTPGGSESIEPPETLDSLMSKLQSAVAGLNTSLGYTPAATPSAKPTAPSIKPTPAASSSGSKMSKSSEEAARLEEAAAAVQGSGQIVPFPINTSVTTSAAFSGQQVYTPRSPITYGI